MAITQLVKVEEHDSVANAIENQDQIAKSAFNKNFGSTADTVCEGNDPRLSDARTPLSHIHDDRYYTETEIDQIISNLNMEGWIVPGQTNYVSDVYTPAGVYFNVIQSAINQGYFITKVYPKDITQQDYLERLVLGPGQILDMQYGVHIAPTVNNSHTPVISSSGNTRISGYGIVTYGGTNDDYAPLIRHNSGIAYMKFLILNGNNESRVEVTGGVLELECPEIDCNIYINGGKLHLRNVRYVNSIIIESGELHIYDCPKVLNITVTGISPTTSKIYIHNCKTGVVSMVGSGTFGEITDSVIAGSEVAGFAANVVVQEGKLWMDNCHMYNTTQSLIDKDDLAEIHITNCVLETDSASNSITGQGNIYNIGSAANKAVEGSITELIEILIIDANVKAKQ